VCPDVEVFVAITGAAVPVALDVVWGLVGHDDSTLWIGFREYRLQ
jgi:hypothetical protein